MEFFHYNKDAFLLGVARPTSQNKFYNEWLEMTVLNFDFRKMLFL